MARPTGEQLDFAPLVRINTAPVYKLGVHGNKVDPEEEAAVKAAFDLIAKTGFTNFGPGPRRTLVVSLLETDDGTEIAVAAG